MKSMQEKSTYFDDSVIDDKRKSGASDMGIEEEMGTAQMNNKQIESKCFKQITKCSSICIRIIATLHVIKMILGTDSIGQ